MNRFLVDRATLGARAVAARLQVVAMLDRRPLLDVLGALTLRSPIPREVVEAVVEASERAGPTSAAPPASGPDQPRRRRQQPRSWSRAPEGGRRGRGAGRDGRKEGGGPAELVTGT